MTCFSSFSPRHVMHFHVAWFNHEVQASVSRYPDIYLINISFIFIKLLLSVESFVTSHYTLHDRSHVNHPSNISIYTSDIIGEKNDITTWTEVARGNPSDIVHTFVILIPKKKKITCGSHFNFFFFVLAKKKNPRQNESWYTTWIENPLHVETNESCGEMIWKWIRNQPINESCRREKMTNGKNTTAFFFPTFRSLYMPDVSTWKARSRVEKNRMWKQISESVTRRIVRYKSRVEK